LDYDGTLSPIALKPELAILPPETKKLLEELSKNTESVYLAIISGRSIEDVKDKVQIEGLKSMLS
jgi:trehalose 6-phosphate synthase/phosphatase